MVLHSVLVAKYDPVQVPNSRLNSCYGLYSGCCVFGALLFIWHVTAFSGYLNFAVQLLCLFYYVVFGVRVLGNIFVVLVHGIVLGVENV